MSVYQSLRLLSERKAKPDLPRLPRIHLNQIYQILYPMHSAKTIYQLENIVAQLDDVAKHDNYNNIQEIQEIIQGLVDDLSTSCLNKHITKILNQCNEDINKIISSIHDGKQKDQKNENHRLDKYNDYRIHTFNQKRDFRNGIGFRGACYGYGTIYSAYRLQNPGCEFPDDLHYTLEVDRAQKGQRDKNIDYEKVRSKRLDRKRLEVNIDKRADRIAYHLINNQGQELAIGIIDPSGSGHDLRASMGCEDTVTFFDSNHGQYKFPDLDSFKSFYTDLHRTYEEKGYYMSMYEVMKLTLAGSYYSSFRESAEGKWRTLLSGGKHNYFLGILTPLLVIRYWIYRVGSYIKSKLKSWLPKYPQQQQITHRGLIVSTTAAQDVSSTTQTFRSSSINSNRLFQRCRKIEPLPQDIHHKVKRPQSWSTSY